MQKIPLTIHEAVQTVLSLEGSEILKKEPTTTFHHTLGREIRNDWGLWNQDSILHKEFNAIGIYHADDMSGIIFDTAQKILNGESVRLKKQVDHYKRYWKGMSLNLK